MKENKHKILVLSDLKDTTINTLTSAISIAKMIQGSITFFHVKKPTDVVKSDSQLSAIRTINKEYNTTDKKMKSLIAQLTKEHEVRIDYNFSFGNIKNEINQFIEEVSPDMIILGKRKSTIFNFTGDNLTHYLLKEFNGPVFIAESDNSLKPSQPIFLGFLNSTKKSLDIEFTQKLLDFTKKPLVSFNVSEEGINSVQDEEALNYVFKKNDNILKSLSSYLVKNRINLLCIDRNNNGLLLSKPEINTIINKLNVSLLLTNN